MPTPARSLSRDLAADSAGQTVRLAGWVHRRRDHGGKIFVDLRDRAGLTQIVADPAESPAAHKIFEKLRPEWCVAVEGAVRARPAGQENPAMASGAIEILAEKVEIFNESETPPFEIADGDAPGEEIRYKYRFLDLRRASVAENLRFRAAVTKFARDWFSERDFCEVQTPLLTNSSPEGSRDFLVPSRLHPGKFYALPQAPQQFKQLLMVGGLERYFQVAPCLRDEDPRADRVAEHWQLDVEASFVGQDEFLALVEPFFTELGEKFSELKKAPGDFPKIPFREALRRWGSDKPDLRFGLEIAELTDLAAGSGFGIFEKSPCLRAIRVPAAFGDFSRKDIDELTEVARRAGAGGLAWLRVGDDAGPVAKNSSADFLKKIAERTAADPVPVGPGFPTDAEKFGPGDLIFFGAGDEKTVEKVLGAVRLAVRDRFDLADRAMLAWAWIVDFPMFAREDGRLDFEHNPFSKPAVRLENFNGDPTEILSNQFDLIANGVELFSGGVRQNEPAELLRACAMVGYSETQTREMFGHIMDAYRYGGPLHTGLGMGVERICSVLRGRDENIREFMAFPKTGTEEDLMMRAPAEVPEAALRDAGIAVRPEVLVKKSEEK